ncbi:hypothetical protein [Henriciella aquimarina]|uniref:hypothetical protein n=1 Tax=Henriciella aquimarina TaxID=545261 RepID=UPI0009FD3874|nr:hypothetical protein [Henriciella aquimarina]
MSINDPKYSFSQDRITNVASGEVVPEDEPCMVFRARDRHAISVIKHYISQLIEDPDVPSEHLNAVLGRLDAFREFRADHPQRMKAPDTLLTPGDNND